MMSDDDLDRIERLAYYGAPEGDVRSLVGEVRRLRDEVAGWRERAAINDERYLSWRSRWEVMAEIAGENKAEVRRMADAIRTHREATEDRWVDGDVPEEEAHLWQALDQEDDR